MKRIKPTPLFIISSFLIVISIGFLLHSFYDDNGWDIFGTLVLICLGLFGLLIYGLFRIIFNSKIWTQTLVELSLLSILVFYDYKRNPDKELIVPPSFKGFVFIIYGVDDAPKLKQDLFSDKIKIKVPESGIITTVSNFNQKLITYVSNPKIYTYAYLNDFIKCNDKKYPVEILLLNNSPMKEKAIKDSTILLKNKLQMACSLLKP